MVKGNSARRKELAQGRRQDRKNEVERKKAGASRVTPMEARARILSCASLSSNNITPVAWCSIQDGKSVCESWFRTESCPRKRCKYDHSISVAHLKFPGRIISSNGDGDFSAGCQKQNGRNDKKKSSKSNRHSSNGCLPPMVQISLNKVSAGGKLEYDPNLRTQRRTQSNLLFIEFNGVLCFDAFDPNVFALFAAEASAAPTTLEENVATTEDVKGKVNTKERSGVIHQKKEDVLIPDEQTKTTATAIQNTKM